MTCSSRWWRSIGATVVGVVVIFRSYEASISGARSMLDERGERPRPQSGRASGPLLFRAAGIPTRGFRSCALRAQRPHDVVEVLERLEGDVPGGQVLREAIAGEDARGRQGDAAVGEPVADVDEAAVVPGDVRALARLAADVAHVRLAKQHAPSVRTRVDPVRDDVQFETFARQDRLDQLVEPARDD